MKRFTDVVALTLVLGALAGAQALRVPANATVFIEESEFGQALSAAIIKKKVPVLVSTNREKAEFVITETSNATKEGTGERVAKVLAFGVFAGSGKTYEASVTVTNPDGVIVFAHNAKKGDIRGAAEDVANKLKDHITKK
jgi:hypothetical protein